MVITSMKQQKNSQQRYSVFVDGRFAFGVTEKDIADFQLKEGKILTENTYHYIMEHMVYQKAQRAALHFLERKYRTKKEVSDKLVSYGYSDSVIERVLFFLEKYGYVDDWEYAQRYLRQRQKMNPRGQFLLKRELREKGIEDSLIEKAFCAVPQEELSEALKVLGRKAYRYDLLDSKDRHKLYQLLLRRGFSYDTAKKALDIYFKEDRS